MTGRFKQELLEKGGMSGMSQKSGHMRPTEKGAGMTPAGVKEYRRRKKGSKLKTAVTTPPSKLKPGSKAAKRRKSFCARSRGWTGERGKAARRRWNCSTDVNPNSLQNMVENFYIDLAVEEFIEMHESQGTDIGNLHGDFLSESCSYWLDNISQVREAFGNYVHPSRKGAATKPQDDPLQRMAGSRTAGRAPRAQVSMKPKAASNFMGDTMKRGIPRNKPIPKATPSRFGALGDITKSIAGRYADPARGIFDDVKSFMTDPRQRQKAIDAGKSRLKSIYGPKEIGDTARWAARGVGRKIGGGIRSRLRGAGDRFKKFINRRIVPDETNSKFESLSDYELDRLVEHFIKLERTRNGMAEMILNRIQENGILPQRPRAGQAARAKLARQGVQADANQSDTPQHGVLDTVGKGGGLHYKDGTPFNVSTSHPDYLKKKLYNRPTKGQRMPGDTEDDVTPREPIEKIHRRGLTNKSPAKQARAKKKFAKLDKIPSIPDKLITRKGSYADQEWEPSMSQDTIWNDDDDD